MNYRICVFVRVYLIALLCAFSFSPALAAKIHPALQGPKQHLMVADSVDVWIFFTNRGLTPTEIQSALRQADQSLLPENRKRRQKVFAGSLVSIRDLPVNAEYVHSLLQMGARYRTVSRYFNALSARIHIDLLGQIANLPYVDMIQPVAKAFHVPPEPDWLIAAKSPEVSRNLDETDYDYGPSFDQLQQINVIAVHDSGFTGDGVLVCLLDTGFFKDHEALVNQPVVAEWDFLNNDPETQNEPGDDEEQQNHGTYTFSALGGLHEGDLYGPAFGASFILGKTESVEFEEPIEEDYYVAGLEWADSLGAQVVSTSLGYLDWYTFEDLDGNTAVTTIGVDIAVTNGIVVITAAGNERGSSWDHIIAPADADSVISVGAVNENGTLASFSSPGPTYDGRIKPEVCARGVNTWCATPWNGISGYWGIGGTSLATPLVGGSCALILEAHPDWTPMMVRMALMYSADNALTPNNDYGWGIIDVYAAINFNFPPTIVSRDPNADSAFVILGDNTDFWVSAEDYECDTLTYRWLVDSDEVQYGADSAYSQIWQDPGYHTVEVQVEDGHGGFDQNFWTIRVDATAVGDPDAENLPDRFALHNSYPNPFNPTTEISFDVPQPAEVTLDIYNSGGRLVAQLSDNYYSAGKHQMSFNASGLSSGIYLLKMTSGDFIAVQKLVLLK